MKNDRIIPRGTEVAFAVKIQQEGFNMERDDFAVDLLYGMSGKHVRIEKSDMRTELEGRVWLFDVDTTDMIAEVTAVCYYYVPDVEASGGIREMTDRQTLMFVVADSKHPVIDVADDEIDTRNVSYLRVVEGTIGDGEIIGRMIADQAVTTDKIADNNVTEDKLADKAVTTDKLADDTITELTTIMDSEPVEGSVKPIQSGGVFEALMDRVIMGDIVGDPAAAWEPGSAEAYIDQRINEQNNLVNTRMDRQDIVIKAYHGNKVVIVDELPDSGEEETIYRVPAADHYTDYMWDTSLETPAFSEIATFDFPGIDDVPTANSNYLVKSGGVWDELLRTELQINGSVNITNEIPLKFGYIDTDGSIKSAQSWKYGVVKLFAGETITIANLNIGNYPSLGLASSSAPSSVEVLPGKTYTAVADCLVAFCTGDGLVSLVISVDNSVPDEIAAVQSDIDALLVVKNYTEGKNFNANGVIVNSSYAIMSAKIPAVKNNSVVWTFNNESDNSKKCYVQEYAADGTKVDIPWSSTENNNPAGTRTFNIWGTNTAYIIATFVDKEGYTPKVTVNGVEKWTREENGRISEIEETLDKLVPTDNEHGIIGKNYPEQMYDIFTLLNAKLSNRLHFIHISDNHNGSFGSAENFLDYCPAKFLINTGDLVNDKFSDGMANTIAKATAPEKPVYLVLGNHDYSHATSNQAVFNAFFGDDETEGTVNYHNVQAGGVATDKTYYSIDFATEKVRCIVLDMNDGWTDEELPSLGPSNPGSTAGKMSETQIRWFVSQLQDAKTNNYHVCVFIHTLPYDADAHLRIHDFSDVLDSTALAVKSSLTFLPSIIDGFISGGSVQFSYNGTNYDFTFSSGGHFVAWFCGHTHWDIAGWMKGHTDQFMINVCQPFAESYSYQSTYDGDRLGVHWNYVTVDTGTNSLSVYRVGQQDTIHATKRKSFRILYK